MKADLELLLSDLYRDNSLAPDHLADLRRSGLTDETIRLHRIRSVPPSMIGPLLRFDIPAIRSAMLIPFPAPAGGFMDHVRLKIFPPLTSKDGQTVKYLQPRGSGVRLFFPLPTLPELGSHKPLWLVEGEKKALTVTQLGLPAVGFCGIEGWHLAGPQELIDDFDHARLMNRLVELVPDGDWRTNHNVARGTRRLAAALEARGASVRLVILPDEGNRP